LPQGIFSRCDESADVAATNSDRVAVQIILDDLQFTVRQVQVEIGPLILSCNDSAHVIANSASIHQLAAFGDTGAGARVTSPRRWRPMSMRCSACGVTDFRRCAQ
jgi:hypothetical protein